MGSPQNGTDSQLSGPGNSNRSGISNQEINSTEDTRDEHGIVETLESRNRQGGLRVKFSGRTRSSVGGWRRNYLHTATAWPCSPCLSSSITSFGQASLAHLFIVTISMSKGYDLRGQDKLCLKLHLLIEASKLPNETRV